MKYLLALLTSTLSVAKVTCQGSVAKKSGSALKSKIFFSMLMFFSAALLFCPYLDKASAAVWVYASFYALCNVGFQIIYISALSRGNVSVAVMFANFGMVIPIAVSFLMFGDVPSPMRTIGILLTCLSFVFTLKQGAESKRGYRLLIILALLSNACSLSVQKLFGKACVNENIFSFVSASYLISAVLCALIYLAMTFFGGKQECYPAKKVIPAAIGAGVSLGLYLVINTYAGRVSDGSFHYPAHSVCAMLLSALLGFLVFHEKPTRRQMVAYILGVVSIMLMNF
ncbi:MAG: EamA family transporter [Clostridia bacterium]|nr:EamA family transporter [Clostridia bacterium]